MKLVNKLKGFALNLLSKESDTSSRRFTGIVVLVLVVACVIVSFFGIVINNEMFYTLASLLAGMHGLTTFGDKKNG